MVSDIAIRLDGIILGLVLFGGALLFAAIAVIAALRAMVTAAPGERSWRVVRPSLWLLLGHGIALALLAAVMDAHGSAWTGPDWIDWLAIPWGCLIVAGLALLVHQRRTARRD